LSRRKPCPALAEVEGLCPGAAGSAEEEEVEQSAEQDDGQDHGQGYRAPVEAGLHSIELNSVGSKVHSFAFQTFNDGVRIGLEHRRDQGPVVFKSGQRLAVMLYPVYLPAVILLALSCLDKLMPVYRIGSRGHSVERPEDERHHRYQEQHIEETATPPFCLHVL